MHIWSMSWYFRQMLGISQTYRQHILGKSKANPRQIAGTSDPYLRRISGTSHEIFLGVTSKKKQYIYRHCPNWWWPPSLLPYFWQIYFWQTLDHVDLPPSPRNFDRNHEILGFEIYIVYHPCYFLRVWGTDRVIYHTKLSASRVREAELWKVYCLEHSLWEQLFTHDTVWTSVQTVSRRNTSLHWRQS